jgi:uncharacterized membrane protein
MKLSTRISALCAYILPVIGWIYIGLFQRKNSFVMFHLRQSIGIFSILVLAFISWAIAGWVLALIPFVFILSVSLFGLVMVITFAGVYAWIIGMGNALRARVAFVPFFGRWANRLPIN